MSKFSNIVNEILVEHLLIEGINEVKPYFPNIPEEAFIQILNLDPTYTGGDILGKYGKWLLTKYNKEFKKNNNTIINNNLKNELNIYDKFKKDIEKNTGKKLDQIKSFNELSELVNQYKDKEETLSNRQQKRNIKSEIEKVYDKDGWLVLIPKTKEASCYYGANTKWCTAGKKDNQFIYYNDQGPLYIIIDTNTDNKWQFHFGEDIDTFTDAQDNYLEGDSLKKTIEAFPKDLQNFFIKLAKYNLSFTFLDALHIKFTNEEIMLILNKTPHLFYDIANKYLNDEVQHYVAIAFPDLYVQNIKKFNPRFLFLLTDRKYQKIAVDTSIDAIKYIKKFLPEIQEYILKKYPELLAIFPEKFDTKYEVKAKNPKFVIEILKKYPHLLQYMKNPNSTYQKIALENNPTVLYYAKNVLLPEFKNNTEYQIAALRMDPFSSHLIDNLTPEAAEFLKDFHPIQYQRDINYREEQKNQAA